MKRGARCGCCPLALEKIVIFELNGRRSVAIEHDHLLGRDRAGHRGCETFAVAELSYVARPTSWPSFFARVSSTREPTHLAASITPGLCAPGVSLPSAGSVVMQSD